MVDPQKIKQNYHVIQPFHIWVYRQKDKSRGSDTYTPMFSSIIHNSQRMERIQVSINRWLDKQNVVYTYNGILITRKKKKCRNFPAGQWLRLHSPSAGDLSSILGQGTKSHTSHLRLRMPRLKILSAATKTQSSQINKYIKINIFF